MTNPKQIAQIAHHNAQILRQIKGLHPPVTQYHNPFPVLQSSVNGQKHVLLGGGNHHMLPQQQSLKQHIVDKYPTTQNLISSSSNVAQTVMPHLPIKSYVGGKPLQFSNGKPDLTHTQLKYFTGLGASSQAFGNAAATSQNYPIFSTTNRNPIIR